MDIFVMKEMRHNLKITLYVICIITLRIELLDNCFLIMQ